MTGVQQATDTSAGLDGFIEETVTVHGDRIHYLAAGEAGPPLVLLHGGIIDAAHITWRPLLEPLAAEATVYAPNFPGYGPNAMPEEGLSVDRHVRSTAGFLEELDLEHAVVAGISMGGGVAVGLGLDHPDRIDRLVVLDALGLGHELSSGKLTWLLAKIQVTNNISIKLMRRSPGLVRSGLEELVAAPDTIPQELVDLVHAEVQRPDAGGAFRSFRSNEVTWHGYRTDYTDRLTDLDVPVRLIHGEDDGVVPLEWSRRADQLVPDSTLDVLANCGHLPTWERTEAVQRVVEDAL